MVCAGSDRDKSYLVLVAILLGWYVCCQSLRDDIILVSHSIQVMQSMLYICEAFAYNFDAV